MSTADGTASIDRLIHEPARLLLIAHLSVVDEADFVYLSHRTGMTSGNISSHMTRLERAGYVEISKGHLGRRSRTVYRLTQTGRDAFDRYRTIVGPLLVAAER